METRLLLQVEHVLALYCLTGSFHRKYQVMSRSVRSAGCRRISTRSYCGLTRPCSYNS